LIKNLAILFGNKIFLFFPTFFFNTNFPLINS
jgi:hypothetical protein